MSAELVSVCYLHCVLKGLHKAPSFWDIGDGGISCRDIDFMVSPFDCFGEPHYACLKAKIPIIRVMGNSLSASKTDVHDFGIIVQNYLEVIGVIQAMKIGVTQESVTRPLSPTKIFQGEGG